MSEQSQAGPTHFSTLKLSPSLLQVVKELGFERMTPIQAESIPLLLQGRDLLGQSKTGSGKTAAFTLPILQKIKLEKRVPQALVLCPTRELCTQVAGEIRKLGRRHPGLQVLIVSGGQPIYPQLTALERGVHIVVGTPGRVIDHLMRSTLDLSSIATVVLDEADRMLDMGFQEDMEKILSRAPVKRQTALFSATYPSTIASLSRKHQREAVPVRIDVQSEDSQALPAIRQLLFEVPAEAKLKALMWLLQQHQPESAIIFCNFKASVAELAKTLAAAGVSCGCLHGDLEQQDRDRVMAKFRNQSTRILVATDVAARGIDVADLDAVFNFELPSQAEIYVHRIGRTGRAGKKGIAISLATTREQAKVEMIERLTGVPMRKKQFTPGDSPSESPGKSNVSGPRQLNTREAKMETLFVSGGRKDKVRPGDILGALTGEAGGLPGAEVGKIEIHDRFSYVAISRQVAHLALQRLRDGRIKGRKFRIELVK